MSRLLTEQNALKKLGIEDFRHLTKEKAILMASMLDKMDPEVAKKALEQFPEFVNIAKEMVAGYKETLDKGLESNEKSVQEYYGTCKSIIDSLQKQLEVETLSFEEKKYIMDRMLEVSRMMSEKDSENKRFIAKIAVVGAMAIGVVASTLISALGGNTTIRMNDNDDFN